MLLLAGGCLSAAAAIEITSTEEFSNDKVYLLMRDALNTTAGRGYAYVEGTGTKATLFTAAATKTDTTKAACHFSIHYSPREKAFYLYNLGSEMFITGNSSHQACVSSSAVDCVPLYSELAEHWLLDCGGYVLASDREDGFTMFYDDLTLARARQGATHFLITEKFGETVAPEVSDAIEAKIAASRESALKVYRNFLSSAAKVINTNELGRYLGEYDLEALTYALDHEEDYSIAEIEAIYQETLLSRYPKPGHYYRIHNGARPVGGVAGRPNNYLSTDLDGTLRVRTLENPAANVATEGTSDDLVLFRFWPVDGDRSQVNIEAAAFGEYFAGGANTERVGLGSLDGSTVYELSTTSPTGRVFRMSIPSKNSHLSVTSVPDCYLWGYSTLETANQWYIEPVDSIVIPVDDNGYATACLPCGIALPEGAKAYTVTDVSAGKAYVEEVASPIHLGTPLILKAAPGKSEIVVAVENTTKWVASEMTGNRRATAAGMPGRYVPRFSASGITFAYEPATETGATPGSCYIVSDDQGALQTVMGANPDASIEEISAAEAAGRKLYDLTGRPVTGTPRPGVYVDATTRHTLRIN